MKWMKPDARSVRIKNWVGKNMVNIYSHGSDHDKIGLTPIFFKKYFRNEKRKNKMHKIMEDFPDVKYFTHSKIIFAAIITSITPKLPLNSPFQEILS